MVLIKWGSRFFPVQARTARLKSSCKQIYLYTVHDYIHIIYNAQYNVIGYIVYYIKKYRLLLLNTEHFSTYNVSKTLQQNAPNKI